MFWYLRPLFNVGGLLPVFAPIAALPFFALPHDAFHVPFAVLLGGAYAVVLGVKNLILTHRAQWLWGAVYVVGYLVWVRAFIAAIAGSTAPGLVLGGIAMLLIWRTLAGSTLVGAVYALILTELAWAVMLLPIGFLSSANVMLLAMFLLGDALLEGRIAYRNLALASALLVVIFASSYWHL
jgi:hypothetical protein